MPDSTFSKTSSRSWRDLLSLGGALWALAAIGCRHETEPHRELPPPLVRVVSLAETSPEPVARWGIVEPSAQRRLAFTVGGRVARVNARAGDRVRRGEVLAFLEDAAARAGLRAARIVEDRAQAEARTSASLLQSGSMSARQADLHTSDWQLAIARHDSARQLVAELRLIAPADGVVRDCLVEPGESVAPGQPAFVVEDEARETITVGLTYRDVARVLDGTAVEVSATEPPRTVTGRILRRAPSPSPEDGLFKVEVELGPEARLPPGAVVSVAFPVEDRRELRVPSDAIVRRRGESYVARVSLDANVSLERVRIAAFDGGEAIVGEGLAAGDRIVAEGAYFLFDGQPVRVLATRPEAP